MTHVDTPSFAIKTNLANLKNDKLGIKKLVPVPTDLSNLRNVVKIDVVKETVYDKLVSELFDLIAQIMSTPCASETILSSSTSMLRISLCSQDGKANFLFDEINLSLWWSSSWFWIREILFICLMYPRIIRFWTHMTKPFQSFIFYYFYNIFLWTINSSDLFISYSFEPRNPKYWS